MGPFTPDRPDERIRPMTVLATIVSDLPIMTFDARRNPYPETIPAALAAEAGTRSALLWLIGDMRFPASLIASSRLAADLVRRGPPFSFTT